MDLTDNLAVKQVIGSLMHNTLLLLEYPDIVIQDFEKQVPRVCFGAIDNLYKLGATKLSIIEVENEILKIEGSGSLSYRENHGLDFLKVCYQIAEPSNFNIYYQRLKKYSLLRSLYHAHYDISDYCKEDFQINSPEEARIMQERFDSATLEDIFNNVESKFNEIKNEFVNGRKEKTSIAAGLDDLLDDLSKNPDQGPALEGEIFNMAVRGARAGKFFLRSAASNVGKTRTAVFDACRLAYPVHYSIDKDTFVQELTPEGEEVQPRKVLFIVTEMERSEIQTIVLAYLSGVNEENILTNKYNLGEEDRVKFAKQIIKKYDEYFIFEEISDPNLVNVETTIKKYATVDDVKFIYYDYIHSTPSLMEQFSRSGLREESVLMLLSNQLKQIAKDNNVFIFSATQVNAVGMTDDGEFKNMTAIRGAKSIADKIDVGFVITKISDKMWNSFMGDFRAQAASGLVSIDTLENNKTRPTHIIDLYKNRRGRYKDIRIWTKLDLGTGYRKDIMMTTMGNVPMSLPVLPTTATTEITKWRDYI